MTHGSRRLTTALIGISLLVLLGATAHADPPNTLVSFGVEAGQPTTETIGGLATEPLDVTNIDVPELLPFDLPVAEDIDAFHYMRSGYSLFFDEETIDAVSKNVDAFTLLPNGNLLLSTQISGEIYGFAFQNGDVVEVDPVAETAGLFMGLDEATLFTGANQDIDALHYDWDSGNLLISLRTAGTRTIGGLAYTADEADLFELDPSGVATTNLFLDGFGLYDGSTRQLDSAFVPEPAVMLQLLSGVLMLGLLGRSR